jgi:acetyl esterase/lipase
MRNALALAVALIALAVEMWTVVPAPNGLSLVFGVIVPEIAPWGVIASALSLAVAARWSSGKLRWFSIALSAAALACALLPLFQLPGTIAASDAAISRALGPAHGGGARFDLVRFFRGERQAAPIRVEPNLPFVTRDGARLALDLYRAPGSGVHPAVVVIFGGGWRAGGRGNTAAEDRKLAALGYTTLAIDYRLVPAYRFPTQLHDVEDALAAIARNAKAWGVDPKRVALLGRSAGGELALVAAYRPQPLTIRAVVGYYAPVDLAEGYREPPVPDPAGIRTLVSDYLGGPPAAAPQAYRAASPLAYVRAGLPPTFLIGGERDELVLVRFQRQLRDALAARGDRVVALELPWSNHAFDAIPDGLGGQLARSYVAQFLAATL